MVIRTRLACWLCRKTHDLLLDLLDGVNFGAPRYWCARCTSTPRIFARLLRERIVELQADVRSVDGEEILFVQQVLARQMGTDAICIPIPIVSKAPAQSTDRLAA
jgi:hypothetical protein